MKKFTDKQLLRTGINHYGSATNLAKALNITRQYITNMKRGFPMSKNIRAKLTEMFATEIS